MQNTPDSNVFWKEAKLAGLHKIIRPANQSNRWRWLDNKNINVSFLSELIYAVYASCLFDTQLYNLQWI